jgi:hypothetical protein
LRISRRNCRPDALKALLAREVASIVVDDFYSAAACATLVDAVRLRGLKKTFAGTTAESRHDGMSATDYKDKSEQDYLADVAQANQERRRLLDGQDDPSDAALEFIGSAWPAGATLASVGGRPYFNGVVRIFNKAPTHNDWVPRDLGSWFIGGVHRQLSWHLYLSTPVAGGEFVVWDRQWDAGDDDLHRGHGADKGYDQTILQNIPAIAETPAVGRLMLFDTRNYHAVREVEGQRQSLVISSFLGIIDERTPLAFWS